MYSRRQQMRHGLFFPHSATRANQSAHIRTHRSRRQRAATGRRCNQVARSLSGASRLDLQLSSSQATGTPYARVESSASTLLRLVGRLCGAQLAQLRQCPLTVVRGVLRYYGRATHISGALGVFVFVFLSCRRRVEGSPAPGGTKPAKVGHLAPGAI